MPVAGVKKRLTPPVPAVSDDAPKQRRAAGPHPPTVSAHVRKLIDRQNALIKAIQAGTGAVPTPVTTTVAKPAPQNKTTVRRLAKRVGILTAGKLSASYKK